MALTITENWESGGGEFGKDGQEVYTATVKGNIDPLGDNADDSATVVLFAVQHFSWISRFGFVLNTLAFDRVAVGTWKFTATYKSSTYERQTNDASFTFTTGGGNQHITCSRKTKGQFGATRTIAGQVINTPVPDYKGAIGVYGNEIAGVDIEAETFDFKITFYLPPSKMTQSYMNRLKSLTKRVNTDVVTINVDGVKQTFQPGELRFIEATGQKRVGFGDWEFSLHFSSIANQLGLTIGPIKNIIKNGWDYLWVSYAPAIENVLVLASPQAVYVEQVYDEQPLLPLIPIIAPNGTTTVQPWAQPNITPGNIVS